MRTLAPLQSVGLKPGTPRQLGALGALQRLVHAANSVYRLDRCVEVFETTNCLNRHFGHPENTWMLFLAQRYFRLTFRVEGKKVFLR